MTLTGVGVYVNLAVLRLLVSGTGTDDSKVERFEGERITVLPEVVMEGPVVVSPALGTVETATLETGRLLVRFLSGAEEVEVSPVNMTEMELAE